jgi:hypothetical protein
MILVVSIAVAIAGWLMLREERQRARAIQNAARG